MNLVEILQSKESETRFDCGQVNIDSTPHQPVDSVFYSHTNHNPGVFYVFMNGTDVNCLTVFSPLCANHPKVFLFSKNLNASLFFIRIVWESLKSSTSLSLWQSFNTPDWSVTSRWVNMKLQSQVFLHALCCWMSNTAGWREGTIIYIIYTITAGLMFSSSCVGPGQHPACGCGLQH